MMFVIPAVGLKVRKPDGGVLPAEGEMVLPDSYWSRRLKFGDVTIGESPRKHRKSKSEESD